MRDGGYTPTIYYPAVLFPPDVENPSVEVLLPARPNDDFRRHMATTVCRYFLYHSQCFLIVVEYRIIRRLWCGICADVMRRLPASLSSHQL
jgi:hypothetical protein